jgi:hypothetical protein
LEFGAAHPYAFQGWAASLLSLFFFSRDSFGEVRELAPDFLAASRSPERKLLSYRRKMRMTEKRRPFEA